MARSLQLPRNSPLSTLIQNGVWKSQLLQDEDVAPFRDYLQSVIIKNYEDKMLWDSRKFSFKYAWRCVKSVDAEVQWHKLCWGKSRPQWSTTAVFVLLDRLPSMCNLQRRKVYLAPRCSLCQHSCDTTDHLFVACPFSQAFWAWMGGVLGWNLHQFQEVESVWGLFLWMDNLYRNSRTLQSLFAAGLWHIWRERNNRLHGSTSLPHDTVARIALMEVIEAQNVSLQDIIP
ncbi:uncharacterized protein LOC132270606 [Cornus florida]|uniref:uncharacterized protein LOC132270606 n=1 Tax=Cornus florida TaxID=4283 RepID=UPI0028A05747|nr:uncharacterized protein LOC132270606 [Cornus florida]